MKPTSVILASGVSRRFGGDKLRALWGSEPLLSFFLRCWPYDLFEKTVVVTREDLVDLVAPFPVEIRVNFHPENGQGSSIRLGIQDVTTQGALFVNADMPLLTRGSLEKLIAQWASSPQLVHALGFHGKAGNPVIFPSRLFPLLGQLTSDQTGKAVIREQGLSTQVCEVDCGDELFDIDTQQDFETAQQLALPKTVQALRHQLLPMVPCKVAFVGGGGKTTAIWLLAQYLARQGQGVVVTTSTHMQSAFLPSEPRFRRPSQGEIIFWAKEQGSKLGCADDFYQVMKSDATQGLWVLIEADGTADLPIKAPKEHEPALDFDHQLTLWVCNPQRALAGPISQVAHRPQLVAQLLGKGLDQMLTLDDLAKLAKSEQCGRKRAASCWKALLTGSAQVSQLLASQIGEAVCFDALQVGRDGKFWPEGK